MILIALFYKAKGIPFEVTAEPDPFYSEENMKRLRGRRELPDEGDMAENRGAAREVNVNIRPSDRCRFFVRQ